VSISPSQSGSLDPTWRPDTGGGGPPRWFILFVLVAVAVLFGSNVYLALQLRTTRTGLQQATKQLQAHEEQIAQIEGNVTLSTKQSEERLSALRGEVSSTRGQINQAARQVETELVSKTQQVAERLSAEQKAAAARIGGEIDQIRSAAATTDSKLGNLSGDVSTVKSDVSSTRQELQKTIADLKSVRGDLGVQSGLIATNSSELGALRRLGERNYFEFDLKKAKLPQRVGSVSLKLKGTDLRRNRYTVEVLADDKLTEKKDRTINEPVQFYVAKARIPYEIVVNQIGKDRIVGYLATPKDQGR